MRALGVEVEGAHHFFTPEESLEDHGWVAEGSVECVTGDDSVHALTPG